MEKKQVLGFLGLLYVSKRAIIGEDFLSHLDKAKFVIVANDLTSNQSLMVKKQILSRHLPIDEKSFSSEELGNALGHGGVNFIGILDKKAALAYVSKSLKGAK